MINNSIEWWKYIEVSKLKELLSQLPEGVKYVSTSETGELYLLGDSLEFKGFLEIGLEKVVIDMGK
jgi:hypothetical protein